MIDLAREIEVYNLERYEGLTAADVGAFIRQMMRELKFANISGTDFTYPVHLARMFPFTRMKGEKEPPDSESIILHYPLRLPGNRWGTPYPNWKWCEEHMPEHMQIVIRDNLPLVQGRFRRLGESAWYALEQLVSDDEWHLTEHVGSHEFHIDRLKMVVVKLL